MIPTSRDQVHLLFRLQCGPQRQAQTSERGHFRSASHVGNAHQFQTLRKAIHMIHLSVAPWPASE